MHFEVKFQMKLFTNTSMSYVYGGLQSPNQGQSHR